MKYFRIRSFGRDLSLLSFPFTCFGYLFSRTNHNFPFGCFANKEHITLKISLVNVQALKYLLRLEIFVSEDRQLRATHLILDYELLSRIFQDIGQEIKVGSSRLARIDVSKPRFLARRDLPPVQSPTQRVLQGVAAPREEIDSTHSSLEAEIDQFHFNEEGEVPTKPVELSDSDADLYQFSVTHSPRLIVARIDTNQEAKVRLKGPNGQ